jgi:hypothetical protein
MRSRRAKPRALKIFLDREGARDIELEKERKTSRRNILNSADVVKLLVKLISFRVLTEMHIMLS